jgi:C-terminal peptidase prc
MFMTRLKWTGALGVAAVVLATYLPARADEDRPQPYVVIVGVSNYDDKDIKPRPRAEDDARALYDLFTDKDYLGADAKHVRLLLGGEDSKRGSQPANRENVIQAIKWAAGEARANDPIYLVVLGEGGPLGDLGDRHCYFLKDSTFKGRDKDALSSTEVAAALKDLKSQRLCVMLDVNFKGFNPPEKGAMPEASFSDKPFAEFRGELGGEGEDQDRTPGRVVFLANRPNSPSLDGPEHGVFTEAVLAGLKGAADKSGYEPDGLVTVDELFEYLDKQVPELARKYGKTEKEKEQVAIVLGSPNSHFALSHNPAAFPERVKRLEKFEALVKDHTVPEKLADEGRQVLGRMPKLDFQKELRKLYEQLVDDKLKADDFLAKHDKVIDGAKADRSAAGNYAHKVVQIADMMKADYYKDVNAGELVATGIRKFYHALEEKVPDELEARLKKAKDLDDDGMETLLVDARVALGKREDLEKDKDLDLTLFEMLRTLDPYTQYVSPEELKRFEIQIGGNFVGVGIQIRKDAATDQLLVVTPIKNSPAYKAGIQSGDIITRITQLVDSDGKALPTPKEIPTKGMSTNDAVKDILGPEDTKIKLTVAREGEDKPIDFEITRGRVTVETVFGVKRKTDDSWDFMLDDDKKIGYIRLAQFQNSSFNDIKDAMASLKKQGAKGVILDLRFNPGGLLTSAVDISDLFIDDGVIVKIRPRVGPETKFEGKREGSLLGFPMVCMVNGESASGSEIVSACLQDHHRAWIVGERSYGKGSVQNIRRFGEGQVKLTTATFWRPSGKNLNKRSTQGRDEDEWGVTPDKVVKLSEKDRGDLFDHIRNNEIIPRKGKAVKDDKSDVKDVELDAATEYLAEQIKMASNNPLNKDR